MQLLSMQNPPVLLTDCPIPDLHPHLRAAPHRSPQPLHPQPISAMAAAVGGAGRFPPTPRRGPITSGGQMRPGSAAQMGTNREIPASAGRVARGDPHSRPLPTSWPHTAWGSKGDGASLSCTHIPHLHPKSSSALAVLRPAPAVLHLHPPCGFCCCIPCRVF